MELKQKAFPLLTIFLLLPGQITAKSADELLRTTRQYVAGWIDTLPDLVCRQSTNQFASYYRHNWQLGDWLVAEVAVENKVEHYSLLTRNGEPVARPKEVADTLGSQGEFLSAVRVLFDPASKAEFKSRGIDRKNGSPLHRFDFMVRQKNSQWSVGPGSGYTPAYFGSIWVDEHNGAIHRLDMEAQNFPDKSYVRATSLRLMFSPVDIEGASYVLPTAATVILCTNRLYCERRNLTFSDYHRFTVTTRILP